jgi:Tol biopolymer transport system component
MGEVYRARDTRLERWVAVKVLPSRLAGDPERRARLEREAKAVSSLNHPHICTLHDVGHEQGTDYLVMELVEGETLAERLRKGPLPLDQTLRTGIEIAEALDKAHHQGVTHRDLKPGNVMLTKAGSKLMDFGLASRAMRGGAAEDLSALPTEVPPLTAEGVFVGTVAYMAPEQLEGKEADARSDLWAFGCVLYEMATGRRAFEGRSQASLIGAIMDREPQPITQIQPLTPPSLERLVKACLAKDPDDRLQSAHDVMQELRWLLEAVQPLSGSSKAGWSRRLWLGIVLGALAGALVAATVLERRAASRSPTRPVLRFAIDVTATRRVAKLAFSPDGAQLVYVGIEGGRRALFLHPLDQFEDKQIPGTQGATSAFFSPDGSWIAFFAGGRLNRVRADGSDLSTISTVRGGADLSQEGYGHSGAWAEDGMIVLSSETAALSRLSAPGAAPVPLTRLESDQGELSHAWPQVLPDGKTVLFSVITGMSFDAVPAVAVSVETGTRRTIIKNASAPHYLPTGHLLYADSGVLAAVPFDSRRLQVVGAPVPVVDDLAYASGLRGAGAEPLFALSRAGDLAYVVRRAEGSCTVIQVDTDGRSVPIAELPQGFRGAMSLDPDGRRLALYRVEHRKMSVWTLDLSRGALTKFAAEGNPHAAVWSRDGQWLAFSSDRSGAANIFIQAVDGTGTAERLVSSPHHGDPASWSADGRWLAYAEADPATGWNVWALDLESRQTTPFRRTASAEQHPTVSPDGKWVAYASDESGRFEVYAESFPTGGKRLQMSVDGGAEPQWARDGRQLFYRSGDQLMSVRVGGDASLSAERPVKVLHAPYLYSSSYGNAGYAVAPGGRRFYFLRPAPEPAEPTRINVVVNWLEELRARVAAGQVR